MIPRETCPHCLIPRELRDGVLVCPRCGSRPRRRPKARYGGSRVKTLREPWWKEAT